MRLSTRSNRLSTRNTHSTIRRSFLSLTTCDKEKTPWFNKNIINLIKNKNIFYRSHTTNENSTDEKEAIKAIQNNLISTIENAKSEYYSKLSMKLSNSEASSKVHWSISESFVNDKKIPTIPPLYHNGNFITDFRQKAEFFNSFFAK